MLFETSTFVVRIVRYFANLIAQGVQKNQTHFFTEHNVCCDWSWTAMFVFHAGFLGWVNKLGNVCGVYFALS
jgi:hypothetical protein